MATREQAMVNTVASFSKKVNKKLTDVDVEYATRKTKLALVVLPMWSVYFPPYNLARLAGITKNAGYETEIFDVNIEAYNYSQQSDMPYNLWTSGGWQWFGGSFHKKIIPHLKDFFESKIDEIVSYKPDVIGLTEYSYSEECNQYFAKRLKERLPDITFMVGGPNLQQVKDDYSGKLIYDYIVSGEGENAIQAVMNKIEAGIIPKSKPEIIEQHANERLNISNFPLPDYCNLDFNLYSVPNGASSEFSRGCVAKCTFCSETHFHKYRQRESTDALSEVIHFNEARGTQIFYFLDSLINGNLKALKEFAEGVIESGREIKWLGYARHDGRMDLDYLKTLADGGCLAFNFGCESASQSVLDNMDKKVTVEEMEQNFEDITKVGIHAMTNFLFGFPNETSNDFYQTLQFIWRVREKNLNSLSLGHGFMPNVDTIIGQNPEKHNLSNHTYHNHWISSDHKIAGPHVLSRIKSAFLFTDLLENVVMNPIYSPENNSKGVAIDIRDDQNFGYYDLTFHDESVIKEIDREDFNFDIIKYEGNVFAERLLNEMFPLFRLLWRTRGGYDMTFKFSPKIDWEHFGNEGYISFGDCPYTANFNFSIDESGEWKLTVEANMKQGLHAFQFVDFTNEEGRVVDRAKRLAKNKYGLGKRTPEEILESEMKTDDMNEEIDYSFEYSDTITGKW
jgi:anaerobic magnesium-protoporphyrin IX monomethyl ester cyclase